jgi:hypothetical protein
MLSADVPPKLPPIEGDTPQIDPQNLSVIWGPTEWVTT